MAFSAVLLLFSLLAVSRAADNPTVLGARDGMGAIPVTRDVSKCQGYVLGDVTNTKSGLSASLSLSGEPCTAFGKDITDLTIEVTFDTQTRLHVKIYDTAKNQFQIPESLIERAGPTADASADASDLVFNYNAQPFEFWVTRKGDADDVAPLFDTRKGSLPATPVPPVHADDASTALPEFNLIFEDQYLEITTALPKDTNLYGLGEYYSSSGFRRDTGGSGGAGSVQALITNGWSVELDRNSYSVHPFYTEHRLDASGRGRSHGVLVLNSSPGDVLLLTPLDSDVSVLQYRFVGGILDLYVFSGPSPVSVVEQYGALVGLPLWTPTWAFGFHLCRWGYTNVDDWRSRVDKMREANIPLEVQWVDIDFYDRYRDFTSDPQNYPMDSVKQFIADLESNHQRMIPIVDPGIAITDPSESYAPHDKGVEQNVFITMNNGSITHGNVWPGDTYFPDWFADNTQSWWTENLKTWYDSGVKFSGIWLDMNEASNFCDGICGVTYDPSTTKKRELDSLPALEARADGDMTGRAKSGSVNFPPYQIHQNGGSLVKGDIDAFSLHGNGALEYDVHNVFGLGEEKATFNALVEINSGERPFIISRSTFPSAGRWTGHWLGDNHASWWSMWASIQGMLQFTMSQIPMVGADTCGHMGETTEDLCNRWMMMSAFTPFYRNHHTKDDHFQEPYLWDSVAEASRIALAARYTLLPYWATLFADVSLKGTPPMRALFWEFPDDASLFGVDQQFMAGPSILVTPVLEPDVTTVQGVLPGNEDTETWYDFWTHERVAGKGNITLPAPLGALNVHVRGGSALLLHAAPAYTTTETRAGPYALLVALRANGTAAGSAYLDDGVAYPPGPSTRLTISTADARVELAPSGEFTIEQNLTRVEVLGAGQPAQVTVDGAVLTAEAWQYDADKQKLTVNHDGIDLNNKVVISWAASTPPPTSNCSTKRRSRRSRR